MFPITRKLFDNLTPDQIADGVNADIPLSNDDRELLTRAACKHLLHGWDGINGARRARYMVRSDGEHLSLMIMKKATKRAREKNPDKEYEDLRYFRCAKADVLAYCEKQGVE